MIDDQLDEEGWAKALQHCGVRIATSIRWASLFEQHVRADAFSLGWSEVPYFTAQILHESGLLEHLEENLNYVSPEALMRAWPRRFPTVESTQQYRQKPELLASYVYGSRADLGNTSAGDGWNYRGSGLIQVTGKANYELVKRATGIDVVGYPQRMRDPTTALLIAIAWWERKVPDAAMGSVQRITQSVNGGSTGLADRDRLTQLALEALKENA